MPSILINTSGNNGHNGKNGYGGSCGGRGGVAFITRFGISHRIFTFYLLLFKA
jgi:hypothetical protein